MRQLGDPVYAQRVIDTLEVMADDPVNKPKLMAWLRQQVAEGRKAYELRTALRCLAAIIQPLDYLEIGVRLGWSMAQVVCECPTVQVFGIDPWLPGYGDVPNPGPDFVREQLNLVAPNCTSEPTFISGRSQEVTYDQDRFDLITVDGSHNGADTLHDLLATLPLLRRGGALALDDVLDATDGGDLTIRQAWETAQAAFPRYTYIDNDDGLVPIGIAYNPGE